jgi:predicted Rossmann fold flavoprotein
LAVRAHFEAPGVPTVEAPLEKVFPESQRARDVRDALERDARAAGARIRCGAGVIGVEPAREGWAVHLAEGETITCARLLLCPGGMSYAKSGTTGDGYDWLRSLELELVEPVPALAPLASPAAWVRELSGIAVQEVEARLLGADGKVLGRRRRPLLFTHKGVSGPGAMDLSGLVARRPGAELTLALDLAPDLERERLRELFMSGAEGRGAPRLARVLPVSLPKRVLAAVAAQAGASESDPRLNTLARGARHEWIEALKGLRVPITGTLGFDQAEVTAGGLALGELEAGSLRVRRYPGLFVFGELVDLDGPIGGLNFQAASATAELAARAAARADLPTS